MKPCHHTTNTLCGSFCQREGADTQRGMLSTRVLTFLWQMAAYAWRTADWNSGTVDSGGSLMSCTQTPIWSQTCLMVFMPGLWAGQPVTSTSRNALPWLRGHSYSPWFGWTHLSVFAHDCSAHEHDHHCETAWNETHYWRHIAQQGGIAFDRKSQSGTLSGR